MTMGLRTHYSDDGIRTYYSDDEIQAHYSNDASDPDPKNSESGTIGLTIPGTGTGQVPGNPQHNLRSRASRKGGGNKRGRGEGGGGEGKARMNGTHSILMV